MLGLSGRRCVISIKKGKKIMWKPKQMMSFYMTFQLKKCFFYLIYMCLLRIKLKTSLLKRNSSHSPFVDFEVDEKLLHIGKEMVRKCGYLPLVISLLGGLLSTRKSITEWELVNKNINAYLYRGEDIEKGEEIHGVLSLSYEDLPYYLKPCLLYLGQFKEDAEIHARSLYWMWIAQGMILHENEGEEESLMDIAELYLSELASRCMVKIELEGVIEGRKYRFCKLHDAVRELCLTLGKKHLGLQVLNYQGGKFSTLLHACLSGIRTRHLTINFESELELEQRHDELIITRDEDISKHVRTLQFVNGLVGKKIDFPGVVIDLHKFKLVRVLVFCRFNFVGGKFSKVIGNLIHLRYLCLEQCILDELPSSISNLVYLYSLNLFGSWNVGVPNALKKMSRLKHLILPLYDEEEIGKCRVRVDEGMDELETLIGFNSLVHELKGITRMKNLRHLIAVVCDDESLSAVSNAITTAWNNLQFCEVSIEQSCHLTFEEEGAMKLEKLFRCPTLHALNINVGLGKLLEECKYQIISSKLVLLELHRCEIEDDPMEILGMLPFLQDLKLWTASYVGQNMKCHALGFPCLKLLVLSGLPNLRKWRVDDGAMPILTEIEIQDCPHLTMIPDGLRFVATLQKLVMKGMPHLEKRVSNGGQDFDIVRHVPSIIIYDS